MFSLRFLIFVALAFACVYAAESERAKKDVLLGGAYPYAYSAGVYPGAYVPTAYSAGYAAAVPTAYAGYPYSAGLYRSALYY